MANATKLVKITLTAEQQQIIQSQMGLNVEALELVVENLEERASPGCILIYKDAMSPK